LAALGPQKRYHLVANDVVERFTFHERAQRVCEFWLTQRPARQRADPDRRLEDPRGVRILAQH